MVRDIDQTTSLQQTIDSCLTMSHPKSVFLYAGAGSGKTRALVEAMRMFRAKYSDEFRSSAKQVAVITYTNAACNEIRHRIEYDPIFAVSTIHSFAWDLIRSYSPDIRTWLKANLDKELHELEVQQTKGRAGTKATAERAVQIEGKKERLERLNSIYYFTYNPNGENVGKNSLSHAEVISISAAFLNDKPLMQQILIRKFPVLLIDESQDTQKDLIDAFFAIQKAHSTHFCLSLFGDTMQRIYADGKVGLAEAVPPDWSKPAITINYRCPKRVVRLINKVREGVDAHTQQARQDAPEGFVRLLLVQDSEALNKTAVELEIANRMADITSDKEWAGASRDIKVLTLEHHMAARRGGFKEFFEPLYKVSRFRTGLLDGTLSGIPFFSQQILPLVTALRAGDKFATAQVVKKHSPLVAFDMLKASKSPLEDVHKADQATMALWKLWDAGADPILLEILKKVAADRLFSIPEPFAPILKVAESANANVTTHQPEKDTEVNSDINAWEQALAAPFSCMEAYVQYISDKSPFGTHQGIKGLEFPRVMVILDDNEARGFMFNYEKLLGAEEPSPTDRKNEQEGKETSLDRTRRLFYVTCSRARSSLAVVVYTTEIRKIAEHMHASGWFGTDEIIELAGSQ